ncbi:MAG: hypothetical protein AB2L20_30165 [Mangrovibacterium sp.]
MIDWQKIFDLIGKYEKLENLALFNEANLKGMAKLYSDGEIAFWKGKKDWFADQINNTIWGAWWVNKGCPKLSNREFIENSIEFTNKLILEKRADKYDWDSFFENDVDRFFSLYFPLQKINEFIAELENPQESCVSHPNNKYNFSIPQWAAIYYYVEKLLPSTHLRKDKMQQFIDQNNIDTTFKSFKSNVSQTFVRINRKNDFPIEKLRGIIPFIKEKYGSEIVSKILNDIDYIKEEKRDKMDDY